MSLLALQAAAPTSAAQSKKEGSEIIRAKHALMLCAPANPHSHSPASGSGHCNSTLAAEGSSRAQRAARVLFPPAAATPSPPQTARAKSWGKVSAVVASYATAAQPGGQAREPEFNHHQGTWGLGIGEQGQEIQVVA